VGALISVAHDNAELQMLGMPPLQRLLTPYQPNHPDRGNDEHTSKELLSDEMGYRSQGDDSLSQSHI
jgi:hypothetical protein